jgi:hypothetical protein
MDKEEEKKTTEASLGNLYDMNKIFIKDHEPELTEGNLNSKKQILIDFIKKCNNNYYMLLCNERKDYTVFRWKDLNSALAPFEIANILVDECLKNRGSIRGIDLTQAKDAMEIWLVIDDDAYVYYFFPYDAAVIEV